MRGKIFLTIAVFLLSITNQAFSKTLRVGFIEWPPYQMQVGNEYLGFDNEFIATVLAQLKYPLNFVTLPWDVQLKKIHDHELDLALGVTQNAERESYAYFSAPYRQEVIKLFVLATDQHKYNINNVSDLKNVNFLLGAEVGFYYGQEFSKLMQEPSFAEQVRTVIYTKINVEKLAAKKIDAFIADQQVGQYYIEKLGYAQKIVELPVIINQTDVRVMVGKTADSIKFMEELNTAIGQTVKSEKYKLLEAKYLKK